MAEQSVSYPQTQFNSVMEANNVSEVIHNSREWYFSDVSSDVEVIYCFVFLNIFYLFYFAVL